MPIFKKLYSKRDIRLNYPTFVFHPAPRGDRGAYSLDYAVFNEVKEWGGVLVKGKIRLYDGGDI